MPPLPPIQNVVKAVVGFTAQSIPCVNVFHIHYGGLSPTPPQANQIAQNVHSAWSQAFIALLDPIVTLNRVDVADLSNPLASTGSYVANIPGAAGGTYLPNNVAIVGSWSISNRYRGGKPRTYITGLNHEQMQDANNWLPTTVSGFQTAFAGFRVNINGFATPAGVGPFTLGVVHYRQHNAALATPTFDAFQSVVVRPGVRSQRGRLTA